MSLGLAMILLAPLVALLGALLALAFAPERQRRALHARVWL